MPVIKPVNNISSASTLPFRRAGEGGMARRATGRNAALGLDNFSRLLQNEVSTQAAEAGASGRAPSAVGVRRSVMPPRPITEVRAPSVPAPPPAPPVHSGPPELPSALQAMLARPSGSEAAILALRSSGHKLKEAVESALGNLGKLAAMFESGDEGGSAIGYDRMGGTSYGKYQISSKAGTMDEFIAFLHKKAPHLAKELKAAGPANTGGRKGKMPETWRDISSRDPQGFEKLQHEFVHERLYLPTLRRLKGQGLDESDFSPVMREVLFSTAVQHGPTGAARIMGRAMEKSGGALSAAAWGDKGASAVKGEEVLIKRIYSLRQGQFGSSASHVQKAVSGRLQNEMNTALRMLKTGAMLVG